MTQPTLNPEALEKARQAVEGGYDTDALAIAIRTYLASLPPVNAKPVASDILKQIEGADRESLTPVDRLRLFAGNEDGGDWDFDADDAAEIDRLLDRAAAAIIALQGERDEHRQMRMNLFNDCSAALRRAEAAEAEVARLKDRLSELGVELNEADAATQRARSFRDRQKTGEKG